MSWLSGVATVIETAPVCVIVRCPHCAATHKHSRAMTGSRSVVAGCHTGHTRCREYAIPKP